jgi:hypothetical protein
MGCDFNIKSRNTESIAGGLTSGLLHKKGKWSDLEQESELGLGGWRGDVGEHSLLLDNDLENIWHHSSGVSQSVLLSNVVADKTLIVRVVERGPQVSWREELALSDCGGFLDMQPLAVILEQELMASWGILEGNNKHGTWTVDSHTSSSLVTSGDSSQLVSRPDSEDGSDREVGSTMEDPSNGSNATENPFPPISSGSGTSSEHASLQHPE